MKTWKFAALSFKHLHQGELLRQVDAHPNAEIAAIYDDDPARVQAAVDRYQLPPERVFSDLRKCLEVARPDVVMLCPSTGEHADYVEMAAPYGVHVLVEKPFASSLGEADRIIEAMKKGGGELMVNWPLRWVPSHITTKRLIDEGVIGEVREVHYYDGNQGPCRLGSQGAETGEVPIEEKKKTWWYQADQGGGSLQDYLGYGATLGTWFHGGDLPTEVCSLTGGTEGLEVDEHSITVARYAKGLSKFETRWGTFTNPWKFQPQPRCGFTIIGTCGTIASYDYADSVHLQTIDCPEGRDIPVDQPEPEAANAIPYFIDRLEKGSSCEGPLGAEMARQGQQIVDTAAASARQKKALPLLQ